MKDLFSPEHHQAVMSNASGGCSDADVSMDDGQSVSTCITSGYKSNNNIVNTSTECMSIASPPRTVIRNANCRSLLSSSISSSTGCSPPSSGLRVVGRLRSRLFSEDGDNESETHENHEEGRIQTPLLRQKPSILKTMDLNFAFVSNPAAVDGTADEEQQQNRGILTPTRTRRLYAGRQDAHIRRTIATNKSPHRPSGTVRTGKRSFSFDLDEGEDAFFSSTESPVDMYSSPRISPSSPLSFENLKTQANEKFESHLHLPLSEAARYQHSQKTMSLSTMTSHKSPSSFLTLDGRTVQSKNPFSPMIFEHQLTPGSGSLLDASSNHVSSAAAKMELRTSPASPTYGNQSLFLDMNEASFTCPGSLNTRSANCSNRQKQNHYQGGPSAHPLLPRRKLSKRDCQNQNVDDTVTTISKASLTPRQPSEHDQLEEQQLYQQHEKESFYTRDGYPERTGRYSFTGSPIKEHVELPTGLDQHDPSDPQYPPDVCKSIHKIRRRTKGDDVVAAAAAQEGVGWKRHRINVCTNRDPVDGKNQNDHISPTDIANFPLFRLTPSDTRTLPPTPSKPVRRHPIKKYTPIRKNTGPPPTPMPAIRKARSFDDDFTDPQDMDGNRRHSTERNVDYLSLSPVGAGGHVFSTTAAPPSRFFSDFDIISELGNGSFGNVYKVLSRLDGCMYAIKVAHRPSKGASDKDRMLKEVYALAALSDQADTATFHIVRYHQAWMEENRLYIQTELCTTTLQAEMRQASPSAMPLSRRYKCLREILLALDFIHKNGMVHLDIKPENVFLKNDQFKLGDFGLVSKISSHDIEEGDSRYMSMELLSGDHADLTKSDIFSLGITMYELCLGGSKSLPSNGSEWQSLRAGSIMHLQDTPFELHKIILSMMHPSYQERPCASELLKHPQLLSDEQKMLMMERNKVLQANLALVAQSKKLEQLAPAPVVRKKGQLTRRNTWSFSS